MVRDPLITAYLQEVHQQISVEIEALTAGAFEQLHQVARIQGRIDGLKAALQLLTKVAEEQSE